MSLALDFSRSPHRRWNPLLQEWVLVSPHRTQRPWQGQVEKNAPVSRPKYDPQCYLCPGNARAGGHTNPEYKSTFVFDNDYAALVPGVPAGEVDNGGLIRAKSERGICRVICFSPRHDLTISNMESEEVTRVVQVWTDQYKQLGSLDWI